MQNDIPYVASGAPVDPRPVSIRARALLIVAAAAIMCSSPAIAQEVRGTLTEADGRTPARGVLVLVTRSSDSRVLATVRTGVDGTYRVEFGPEGVVVRALRIGWKPTLIGEVRLRSGESVVLNAALGTEPIELPTRSTVVSSRCDANSAEMMRTATALFEQVLTALAPPSATHAVMTAREQTRQTNWTADERLALSDRWNESVTIVPVRAVAAAPTLYRRGFLELNQERSQVYHVPGPDFFTSEQFFQEYCLLLPTVAANGEDHVGVGFRPVRSRPGVVQIAGAFWFRRDAWTLDRLTFEYEGLPPEEQSARAVGWVEFAPVGDDFWAPTRWEVRMPQVATGTMGRRRSERDPVTVTKIRHLSGVWVRWGEVLNISGARGTLFSSGVRDSLVREKRVRRLTPHSNEPACVGESTLGALRGNVAVTRDPPSTNRLSITWEMVRTGASASTHESSESGSAQVLSDGAFTLCGVPRGRAVWVRILRDESDIVLMKVSVRVPHDAQDPFLELTLGAIEPQ